MGWRCALLAVLLAFGCTRRNDAKYCDEGTCTTPDYPFCDVTGQLGGDEARTCIAVTCSAGTLGECRGDQEVRCNAMGNGYDIVQCERGCDPNADGCRLCDPNETACTNGKVATCDGDGAVISTALCPLGCFETEPRCREIDPSNGLGPYLDMVADPPSIDVEELEFDTMSGQVVERPSGTQLTVPSFLINPAVGGVPVRVFVVDALKIVRASAYGPGGPSTGNSPGPAFAIVARSDIQISGLLRLYGSAGSSLTPGCIGGRGRLRANCSYSSSGGGGGAFATNGAKGGDIPNNSCAGGIGGIAAGVDRLVPLRGGCAGGGVDDDNGVVYEYGALGGGAIQLASRTKIYIDGVIDVLGEPGFADRLQPEGPIATGGGAGGAMLLEAPVVELGPNAQLLAKGGGGAAGCGTGITCSPGGIGASVGVAATAGVDINCPANFTTTSAGAGGGGLGRLRINTRDGVYTKASSSVEEAATTSGPVSTR